MQRKDAMQLDLHSNMFLLFLTKKTKQRKQKTHLHSNMFLLFQSEHEKTVEFDRFTFQYVSIISKTDAALYKAETNLHSNMFLLFLILPLLTREYTQ